MEQHVGWSRLRTMFHFHLFCEQWVYGEHGGATSVRVCGLEKNTPRETTLALYILKQNLCAPSYSLF